MMALFAFGFTSYMIVGVSTLKADNKHFDLIVIVSSV